MLDKSLIPETIPFDFDETYESVKNILNAYGYDVQEGSNAMQIAIAMSYLTSMLNANTAVNINEMLLPLARKRKMVLQNARLLGYEIKHRISYKYRLTLEFGEGLFSIPRYTKFSQNNKTYVYMGDSIPAFEGPKKIEIDVSEGQIKEWKNDPSLITNISVSTSDGQSPEIDYFVDVPYSNIAESGLRVFVSYVDPSGHAQELVEYKKLDSFIIDADINTSKGYIRLDNIEFNTPRIYFKLGNVGVSFPENTRVFVDALISSGSEGAMDINSVEKIKTELDCNIIGVSLISNGAMEEENESIKKNAVLFHNSANRLVIKEDYRGYINRDSRVMDASVWDGGEEFPRKPGNIWLSLLPSHSLREFTHNQLMTIWKLKEISNKSNWYLTEEDIDDLIDSMEDLRIPTLRLHHRHPVYLNFDYVVNIVRYSRSLTTEEWNETIFNVINDYFKSSYTVSGVESFFFEYFQSNLDKRIDLALTDITGVNIELKNSVILTEKNIINESSDICSNINEISNQVIFHLGTPFERYKNILEDGKININSNYLPKLKAKINGFDIDVNFSNPIVQEDVFTYPILAGLNRIGDYRVHSGKSDTIEIVLFTTIDFSEILNSTEDYKKISIENNDYYIAFNQNGKKELESIGEKLREVTIENEKIFISDDRAFSKFLGIGYPNSSDPLETNYISRDAFKDGLKIEIQYYSNNFKVSRNTIPSLNSVEFITR